MTSFSNQELGTPTSEVPTEYPPVAELFPSPDFYAAMEDLFARCNVLRTVKQRRHPCSDSPGITRP